MKKIYLVLLILFSLNNAYGQINFGWANSFGGSASANTKVRTATDLAGNVYVTGIFEGTKTIGSFTVTATGIADAYLAKYDATGTCIWARGFGGTGTTTGMGIAVDDAGFVYVTGTFTNTLFFDSFYLITKGFKDGFISKFEAANGNSVWCRQVGGTGDDNCEGLTIDNNFNVYATGFFTYRLFFTPTDSLDNGGLTTSDVFIAKYDSAGTFTWAHKINGNNTDQGLGIAYSSNYIFAAGSFVGTCQFGNGISLTSPGTSADAFVTKFDLNGTCQWARKGGGAANDAATAISADRNGYPTITGFFASNATFGSISLSTGGTGEMFVVHYDPAGTALWGKQGGGQNDDSGFGIACDSMGYVVVTGAFQGNSSFTSVGGSPISITSGGQSDGFVSKYTPWGLLQFVIKISGTNTDAAMSVAFAKNNNYYIAGSFTGSATAGPFTLTSPGGTPQNFLAYVPGAVTAIDQSNLPSGFSFYPNPADENITIENIKSGTEISIYNSTGQIVYQSKVNENLFEVNTKNWHNGFYYLQLNNNSEFKTQKLVVAH